MGLGYVPACPFREECSGCYVQGRQHRRTRPERLRGSRLQVARTAAPGGFAPLRLESTLAPVTDQANGLQNAAPVPPGLRQAELTRTAPDRPDGSPHRLTAP